MLTIYGIDKLKINTFILGDKLKGPNEFWAVKNILEWSTWYEIHLKCTQCSPVSPILGSDMIITLERERCKVGNGVGGFELKCHKPIQYQSHTYLSPNDMKAQGEFVMHVLKLLNKN
jgi:hypothetical protein